MPLVNYTGEVKRKFAEDLKNSLDKKQTKGLMFNEFRANAMKILYDNPKANGVDLIYDNTHIKIAPTTEKMLEVIYEHQNEWDEIARQYDPAELEFRKKEYLRKIIKPAFEFDFTPPVVPVEYTEDSETKTVDSRIWFNRSGNGVNIRAGYADGNSSTPSRITLGDKVVHMMGGGATGSGKSVMLNTIEANLLLEYAPWELTFVLCDFKKVEGSRFASRIPTPHIDIVAATGSTEYTMSVFDYLCKELHRREVLFKEFGAQKIQDLRRDLEMVFPQVIVIVDEFTQLYENIKTSEALGNDHADEDKRKINSSISDMARLGRSFGMHMLLTSQQLDALDDGIANQFNAGITLKCPGSVSKSLIGNEAGYTIKGKGKGFINEDKSKGDVAENILVRIPYINSEPDEKNPMKLTNLLEIINQMKQQADLLGYSKKLSYYNEDAQIPYSQFLTDMQACKEYYDNVMSGCTQKLGVERLYCGPIISLGKEVKFKNNDDSYMYKFTCKKNENLILSAGNSDDMNYIINLVNNGLSVHDNVKITVINCNPLQFSETSLNSIQCDIKRRSVVPENLINSVNLRSKLIDIQSLFDDGFNGNWNTKFMVEQEIKINSELRNCGKSVSDLTGLAEELYRVKDAALLETNLFDNDEMSKNKICSLLAPLVNFRVQFEYNKEIQGGHIDAYKFKTNVVWILGFDSFDLSDYDFKAQIKSYLESAPKCNIFNIITADIWTKCGPVLDLTENVLEVKADKGFFTDIGLRKNININPNSIQIHSRNRKSASVISMYKI